MNNLELKTIGVQEMDMNEMVQVDGGIIPVLALGFAAGTFSLALGYYAGKALYYAIH